MEKSSGILSLLSIALVFSSCSGPASKVTVSEKLLGFVINRTRRGVPQWNMEGATMARGKVISAEKVSGSVYENGHIKYFVRASSAAFTDSGDVLGLAGGVYVKSDAEGTELFMKDLKWDPERRLYYTDNGVRQVSKGSVTTGDGLTATRSFDRIEIKNPHVLATSAD